MDNLMVDYISNIKQGEVNQFDNMAVIPLFAPEFTQLEFLTLNKALHENLIEISEIDRDGSVPNLKVINHSEIPVLLLDGEELVGAKQNRVLNTSILIKEKSETHIPVSCTEQGRWSYSSRNFADSNNLASSRVRRSKSVSVSRSLEMNGKFSSNQGEVWEEIKSTSQKAQVDSSTAALQDVYNSHEVTLNDYLNHFEIQTQQNGVLILINGEVVGMELLSSAPIYQEYHSKIIKSYALDAHLEKEKLENINIKEKTKEFMDLASDSNQARHHSTGYGCDYRFENKLAVGSSLVHDKMIIHTAFFKKPVIEDVEINISRASTRASFHNSL